MVGQLLWWHRHRLRSCQYGGVKGRSLNKTHPVVFRLLNKVFISPQEIAFPKMVASCCRFLCYFCRISRENQKAMFEHLSYLLENSSVGLGKYTHLHAGFSSYTVHSVCIKQTDREIIITVFCLHWVRKYDMQISVHFHILRSHIHFVNLIHFVRLEFELTSEAIAWNITYLMCCLE